MFDVDKMMELERKLNGEEPAYVHVTATKDVPITVDRINKYIDFISCHVHMLNQMIVNAEKNGKDASLAIKYRDSALKALGLMD